MGQPSPRVMICALQSVEARVWQGQGDCGGNYMVVGFGLVGVLGLDGNHYAQFKPSPPTPPLFLLQLTLVDHLALFPSFSE